MLSSPKREQNVSRESGRKSVADVMQGTGQVPFQVALQAAGTKNFQTTHVFLFVKGQFDFDTGGAGTLIHSALTKVKSRWDSPVVSDVVGFPSLPPCPKPLKLAPTHM